MNRKAYLLMAFLLVGLFGCSGNSDDSSGFAAAPMADFYENSQSGNQEFLAYVHRLRVSLPKDKIQGAFDELVAHCAADTANSCTLLHSSISTGDYPTSEIEVRILPAGVVALVELASEEGEVTRKSTDVEDLQNAIVDSQKRLEMLHQYQIRLAELEGKASADIESLIKVAQELSQVQSDIEYAEGEKAKLLLRTQMDIVHVLFVPRAYSGFWSPIGESFGEFGENLSRGISETVSTLAYLIPWILVVLVLLYFVRLIWRKTRHK